MASFGYGPRPSNSDHNLGVPLFSETLIPFLKVGNLSQPSSAKNYCERAIGHTQGIFDKHGPKMSQICIPASPKTIEWINAISEKTIIWVEIYNQQFQGCYLFLNSHWLPRCMKLDFLLSNQRFTLKPPSTFAAAACFCCSFSKPLGTRYQYRCSWLVASKKKRSWNFPASAYGVTFLSMETLAGSKCSTDFVSSKVLNNSKHLRR